MQISTISPSTFDDGKSVTLTGSGFGASQGQVLIGGVAQNVNTWADNQITFSTVRGSQSLGACRVDVVKGVGGNAEFPYDASRTITQSTKYYVSPTGSDSAAGTLAAPFATLSHALTLAGPGVAVLLLDGTHNWHAINAKFIGSSGSSGSPFLITSAPGHEPVVDCGGATSGYGLRIDNKSYWLLLLKYLE